jgi:hypothetical protein
MTEDTMTLTALPEKTGEEDFLRTVAEFMGPANTPPSSP